MSRTCLAYSRGLRVLSEGINIQAEFKNAAHPGMGRRWRGSR